MPAELSAEALEKAAEAGMCRYHPHGSDDDWAETTEAYRQVWRDIARAAIEAYKEATTPLKFWCTACHQRLTWVWKEDPPAEIACSCGAMVPTAR